MPELPEVETTCRGLAPHVVGRVIAKTVVREPRLRWPVAAAVTRTLPGLRVEALQRRAKYLLFETARGTLIGHLGMSGSMRIIDADEPPMVHDHVDLVFDDGRALRYHDPRRFGFMLWTSKNPLEHKLLSHLGPEPLGDAFSGELLYNKSRGRRGAVKNFIMDGKIVVGVGNIYASEALFRAGIHPRRPAGRVGAARYDALAARIVDVLAEAIEQGGTTLRDFTRQDGQPGYFKQKLNVYGREGQPCRICQAPLRQEVIGQRSSFFCARCQR